MCQDILGERKNEKKFSSKTNDFCFIDWDGVIIPMVMPKIMIPPASFTLASHVPLFIAMFFTPGVAVAVALGTTFGFFNNAGYHRIASIVTSCVCVDWGLVLAKASEYRFKKWTVYFC